jgi:hypothetical protein
MKHLQIATATLVAACLASASASAQGNSCTIYVNAIQTSTKGVPIVPDELLRDINIAVPCLVGIISGLAPDISDPKLPSEAGSQFLSASAALRAIMARQTVLDKTSGKSDDVNLNDFVRAFRLADNIAAISVLTYAARSDVLDARLNAVLILGNVIDNTSVCVPIAHLNDPQMDKTNDGPKGRANLLGVVSVVAPWAYRENYDAIDKTVKAVRARLPEDESAKTSLSILDNITSRLKAQGPNSNQSVPLPKNWSANCWKYVTDYAQKRGLSFNFLYKR